MGGTVSVECPEGLSSEFSGEYFNDYVSSLSDDVNIETDK